MLFSKILGGNQDLNANKLVTTPLESVNDLSYQIAFNAIRFDSDESPLMTSSRNSNEGDFFISIDFLKSVGRDSKGGKESNMAIG